MCLFLVVGTRYLYVNPCRRSIKFRTATLLIRKQDLVDSNVFFFCSPAFCGFRKLLVWNPTSWRHFTKEWEKIKTADNDVGLGGNTSHHLCLCSKHWWHWHRGRCTIVQWLIGNMVWGSRGGNKCYCDGQRNMAKKRSTFSLFGFFCVFF